MDSVNEKTFENRPVCLLADNGSLRPDAILALRHVAEKLAQRTGIETEAVGLLHSNKVGAAYLDGVPGETVETCLRRRLAEGESDFIILPFFLGPSLGVTDWLPKRLGVFQNEFSDLRVKLASCLAIDREGEEILSGVVADRIREVSCRVMLKRPFVAFVDHGTPVSEVNQVRERVGERVRALLGEEVAGLWACSMERRPEPDYAFNEPLLETLLRDETAVPSGDVVVAQFSLSPGRHAGAGGDVDEICREAERVRPGLRVHLTEPLGEHPLVLDLLEQRFRQAIDAG